MGRHRDNCARKARYPQRWTAERALARWQVEDPVATDGVKVYRCPFCCGWHLGHTPSLHSLEELAAEIRGLR